MKEGLFHFGVSFALQKDSPYTERFSVEWNFNIKHKTYFLRFSTMIKQLKEFGLIQHWKQIEMDKVAKITQNDDSAAEFKGLTLSNLQAHIFWNVQKF